jgi:hypothetical protein
MAKKPLLENFIDTCLCDDQKEGKVSQFVLVHLQNGVQECEIDLYKAGPGLDPKVLAERFRGRAESFAADLVGVQHFVLLVFWNQSTEPQARQPFMVTGRVDFNGATEAPDARGERQQDMRHRESTWQQLYKKQEHLDNMQFRINESLARRTESLMNENMQMFEMVKDMMMRQMVAEQSRQVELEKERRATEQQKALLDFAPLLLNTVAGREVFPQSKIDSILIEKLATSIKPEQIAMIKAAGILPDELAGPLFARFDEILEKKIREREQALQLNPKPKDPEKDAAGDVQPD